MSYTTFFNAVNFCFSQKHQLCLLSYITFIETVKQFVILIDGFTNSTSSMWPCFPKWKSKAITRDIPTIKINHTNFSNNYLIHCFVCAGWKTCRCNSHLKPTSDKRFSPSAICLRQWNPQQPRSTPTENRQLAFLRISRMLSLRFLKEQRELEDWRA